MTISELHASTIVKVKVTFGFSGFACSPDEISELLKIQPDHSRVKGAKQKRENGREVIVPESTWSIYSRSSSKDVNDHFNEILDRVIPVMPSIQTGWGVPGFGVLWKNNNLYTGNGPYYNSRVLEQVASLCGEIWHDIYQVDED